MKSAPQIRCGIRDRRGRPGFVIVAPTDEPFIHDLKDEVASFSREYSEQHGGWWIAAPYLDGVRRILLNCFPVLLIHEPEGVLIVHRYDGVWLRLVPAESPAPALVP